MSKSQSNGTAFVTGASTGIGSVYADRLARRGYDLILVARNEEKLTALSARLKSETRRSVTVLCADLVKKADLIKVEATLRGDPSINVFVNNAGVAAVNRALGRRYRQDGRNDRPQRHRIYSPDLRCGAGIRCAWHRDHHQYRIVRGDLA
jgi:NADP-dependent 3-hydroxy acid dehydrogenase YdfG